MELQIAEGNRYLGNGQQALSNVAQFGALAPERIDDIMGQVHDLQTARVLADRSRQEAERLATAMAAAATLRRGNMSQYRSALTGIEPQLRAAAQQLDRYALLIFDMEQVAAGKGINRGPTDMAEARLIAERLVRQRDLLRDAVHHYRQPAQSH